MRTPIIMALMAAAAIPSIASAQSAGEIRHDNRQVREERRELRDAQMYGSRRDIRGHCSCFESASARDSPTAS